MSTPPFSILDRLADSDLPHLASPEEMRVFFDQVEKHGHYQILVWRREADHGGNIECVVTYGEKNDSRGA
jgi:hypothetical protein